MVFAGAGSGKTRIITTRIAHLIEQGVAPWQILAVTFTNKAAGEMRERVRQVSPVGNRAHVSTFHSICARWLREFAGELGFTADFTIYDDADSTSVLKKLIKSMMGQVDLGPVVLEMKQFMHKAKTMGMTSQDVEAYGESRSIRMPDGGVTLYRAYQETLANCNAMDFGDLILNVLLLLRRNVRVREALQDRYRYILVDEFQDTNTAQMELVDLLCKKHGNLFVVGDDDQSIYSWRGATPANILTFTKTYPRAKQVILAENYRSSSNIVNAASAMIANNKHRAPKVLFSNADAGELIEYRYESDGQMEAWYVVDAIKREMSVFPLAEVAVFYRTNAQSRLLEEALRRENIPYRIYGSVKFYDRLEVKDVLAYLRLLVNESDDVAFKRIVNVPARGIGAKAIEQLEKEASSRSQSMLATARQLVTEGVPRLSTKLSIFLTVFDVLREQLLDASLDQVVEIFLETVDYKSYLKAKFPDQFLDKNENIHELSSALAEHYRRNPEHKLSDWLQIITLVRDEEEEANEGVSMMTLHTAKGLEYERVFIVGVEDGMLPHRSNMDDLDLLEEERRLFYVGMTRAKVKLSLLSAHQRMIYNQYQMNDPSQFLREIPREFLQVKELRSSTLLDEFSDATTDEGTDGVSYDYFDDQGMEVQTGASVRHPTYGKGIVEAIEDNFGQVKAVVKFYDFGRRKVAIHHLQSMR